jgi:hypothetical protein
LRPDHAHAMPAESAGPNAAVNHDAPTLGAIAGTSGARPCPPGLRPRRAHRFSRTWRPSSRRHRQRHGANRRVPGQASDDIDVSHSEAFPTCSLKVPQWLKTAAGVLGFIGFAVGRIIFWSPLNDWKDSRIAREVADSEIARRYRRWVNTFEAASAASGATDARGGKI